MGNIPSEWNGKPTEYHVFDGFNQLGTIGKMAYVGGGILTFPAPIIPFLIELKASSRITKNRKEAQQAMANEESLSGARAIAYGPDLNPSAEIGTRFQDAQKARALRNQGLGAAR
jgi:hypothetical protein